MVVSDLLTRVIEDPMGNPMILGGGMVGIAVALLLLRAAAKRRGPSSPSELGPWLRAHPLPKPVKAILFHRYHMTKPGIYTFAIKPADLPRSLSFAVGIGAPDDPKGHKTRILLIVLTRQGTIKVLETLLSNVALDAGTVVHMMTKALKDNEGSVARIVAGLPWYRRAEGPTEVGGWAGLSEIRIEALRAPALAGFIAARQANMILSPLDGVPKQAPAVIREMRNLLTQSLTGRITPLIAPLLAALDQKLLSSLGQTATIDDYNASKQKPGTGMFARHAKHDAAPVASHTPVEAAEKQRPRSFAEALHAPDPALMGEKSGIAFEADPLPLTPAPSLAETVTPVVDPAAPSVVATEMPADAPSSVETAMPEVPAAAETSVTPTPAPVAAPVRPVAPPPAPEPAEPAVDPYFAARMAYPLWANSILAMEGTADALRNGMSAAEYISRHLRLSPRVIQALRGVTLDHLGTVLAPTVLAPDQYPEWRDLLNAMSVGVMPQRNEDWAALAALLPTLTGLRAYRSPAGIARDFGGDLSALQGADALARLEVFAKTVARHAVAPALFLQYPEGTPLNGEVEYQALIVARRLVASIGNISVMLARAHVCTTLGDELTHELEGPKMDLPVLPGDVWAQGMGAAIVPVTRSDDLMSVAQHVGLEAQAILSETVNEPVFHVLVVRPGLNERAFATVMDLDGGGAFGVYRPPMTADGKAASEACERAFFAYLDSLERGELPIDIAAADRVRGELRQAVERRNTPLGWDYTNTEWRLGVLRPFARLLGAPSVEVADQWLEREIAAVLDEQAS